MTDPAVAGAADLVRGLRARLGLTQEELARRLDVSFVTVNRWESGRSQPRGATSRRLDALIAEPPPGRPRLPSYRSTFVGRQAELDALSGPARWVTLTGPSGVGKTRLALEYAAGRSTFAYVTVAEAASCVAADELVVLEADDPAKAAAAVDELLGLSSTLRVVVVSVRPLGVADEVILPVPPLSPPETAALLTSRLPRSGLQQQQAISALCVASGGLPLAVETLAGWASSLTLDEIVQRQAALLDEAMSLAVHHSVELLPDDARRALQLVAVFAAPFSLDDAAAVASFADDLDLVRAMRTLVEAGWLVVDMAAGSYDLATPWRRVLLATLPADLAADVDERHGRHVLASAGGRASPTADLDKALRWAAATGRDELGLGAAAGLWPRWLSSGRIAEGRSWIDLFLSRIAPGQEPLLARAWVASAVLATESGDHAAAVPLAARASRTFAALGDADQQAIAESALGSAYRYLGQRPEARAHFERALALRGTLDDRRGMATSLNNLALLALDDGDLARARQMLARSLAEKRHLADPRSVAIGLCNLAHTLLRLDLVGEALATLAEADVIAQGLSDDQLTGTVAANLGDAHVAEGSYTEALQDFERAGLAYRGHPHDEVVALCGVARALAGLDRRDDALDVLRTAEATAARTGSEHRMNEVRATFAQLRSEPLSPPPDRLTPRQAEILGCLAEGESNREIAVRLNLSVGTVERHLATTYRKLALHNRVEAARYALQRGLLPPGALR